MKNLLPRTLRLVGWVENYDLRLLRRDANILAKENKLKVGDGLLVSGSKYKGARRFQFLIKGAHGCFTMAPQTGSQNLLLSLMIRVAEFVRDNYEEGE
jgi:hypothetical protein